MIFDIIQYNIKTIGNLMLRAEHKFVTSYWQQIGISKFLFNSRYKIKQI